MSAVNETLIRDVVAEVLGKLGGTHHNRQAVAGSVRACAEIGFVRLQREKIVSGSGVARQVRRVRHGGRSLRCRAGSVFAAQGKRHCRPPQD